MTDSEPPASSWRTSEQPPLKRLSRYPERSRLAVPDADCSDFAPRKQLPDVALTDATSTRRLRNRHQRRCQDCLCALYALCALHAFPIGYYSHGEGATLNPRLNAPDHCVEPSRRVQGLRKPALRRPPAPSRLLSALQRLCKPEVTGSIPVRSITREERKLALAAAFVQFGQTSRIRRQPLGAA